MSYTEETLIPVQREWNGWRLSEVRFKDLQDVHWFQPPGAPRALLHGYVAPSTVVSGDLVEKTGGQPPDRLLVCVIKCHMAAPIYTALAARADQARPSYV
ncbi:MAG TPA: hypothetical protein VMO26_18870 [Vicinamibacterales bacterium]|nr:hypothetical protein [Vicinamibacterales bacterium]